MENFLTVTLMSLGLPMITMGDEVRRTQHGNNNAYCHDDESAWFDWSLLNKHSDVRRFVQLIIRRRLMRDVGPEQRRMTLEQWIDAGIKGWHGVKLNQPDWNTCSHSVALSVQLPSENLLVYFIFNAYWEPLDFELPPLDQEGFLAPMDRHILGFTAGHCSVGNCPRGSKSHLSNRSSFYCRSVGKWDKHSS
jgi:isoamylase